MGCRDSPIGPIVVPVWGFLESYKVIPKRNYYGAYGRIEGLGYGVQGLGLRDLGIGVQGLG